MKLINEIGSMLEDSRSDAFKIFKRFGSKRLGRGSIELTKKPSVSDLEAELKGKLKGNYKRQGDDLWPSKADGIFYFDIEAKTGSDLGFIGYNEKTGELLPVE